MIVETSLCYVVGTVSACRAQTHLPFRLSIAEKNPKKQDQSRHVQGTNSFLGRGSNAFISSADLSASASRLCRRIESRRLPSRGRFHTARLFFWSGKASTSERWPPMDARRRLLLPPSPEGLQKFWRIDHPSFHDGNCFYHALSMHLPEWDATAVRRRVHRRLCRLNNAACVRSGTAGRWAETDEVIAAAHAFRRRICVFETANRMWIEFGQNGPRIHMLNHSNQHFSALLPRRG